MNTVEWKRAQQDDKVGDQFEPFSKRWKRKNKNKRPQPLFLIAPLHGAHPAPALAAHQHRHRSSTDSIVTLPSRPHPLSYLSENEGQGQNYNPNEAHAHLHAEAQVCGRSSSSSPSPYHSRSRSRSMRPRNRKKELPVFLHVLFVPSIFQSFSFSFLISFLYPFSCFRLDRKVSVALSPTRRSVSPTPTQRLRRKKRVGVAGKTSQSQAHQSPTRTREFLIPFLPYVFPSSCAPSISPHTPSSTARPISITV